jgi:type III pantothenate kinase
MMAGMYLCIDIGNTRTKAAVFNAHGSLLQTIVPVGDELDALQQLIDSNHIQYVIASVTGTRPWRVQDLQRVEKIIELNEQTSLPLSIVYTSPLTLGRDRVAAACGAHILFPDKNCLVIDAGTCMTMDLVLKSGAYLGGNIAPGLSMRLKAMHEYTSKLPLVDKVWPVLAFGDSTQHALQNGACLGALMEIEGILRRAKDAFGEVMTVMTGGDAAFLAQKLESEIFLEPELVTKGLFKILNFNVL